MTDPVDTDLANSLRASLFLIRRAQFWEGWERDELEDLGVRERAGARAKAIRPEMKVQEP